MYAAKGRSLEQDIPSIYTNVITLFIYISIYNTVVLYIEVYHRYN